MTARTPNVRFVELQGGLNFRDMGGYAAAGGRTVKWGTLFRSGTTLGMTPEDLAHVASYGIRYAYDLRSNGERRRHPNMLQTLERLEYRCLDHDKIPGDLGRSAQGPALSAEQARGKMTALYRLLPGSFREAYRNLFLHLANADLPLVFNCTAGKDRTGVAAALILSALGVERDCIYEDYLLTTLCFERSYEIISTSERVTGLTDVERPVWEAILRADAEYLQAMFDQIETQHGSVANYIGRELAIEPELLDAMRQNLLE